MSIYRVRTSFSGVVVSGGGFSTLYFLDSGGSAQDASDAAGAFWNAVDARLNQNLTWATEPDVDELNVGTGALEGSNAVTPTSGVGASSTEAIPYASQGLLRLRTGVVAGGRELRGRVFIPGMTEADSSGGVVLAAAITAFDAAAASLISDSDSAWVVWSRTHGVAATVATASTWNQFAVLRSRRD